MGDLNGEALIKVVLNIKTADVILCGEFLFRPMISAVFAYLY